MNTAEAKEVLTLLAAYFPGRIPAETQNAWAYELVQFQTSDATAGAREHARTASHPELKELIACVERERYRRTTRERQRYDLAALPSVATPDPEQQERTRKAMRAAIESVLSKRPLGA